MCQLIRARWPHALAAAVAVLSLLASGCTGSGAIGGTPGATTLTVAIVANPQMRDVETLTPAFERSHPGVRVHYVTLPENEARQKITESVATGSREFDVVMISNYETPMWARNGWLTDLQPLADRTPGYDPSDFIGPIRRALSYRGRLYSVPFYGESSFLMYRKDLFAAHHLTMPPHPTWRQVAAFASRLHDPRHGRAGICLRGAPGWGQVLAPLNTVINTFGGRWYDMRWNAQLTSPAVQRAVGFYVGLVRRDGEPAAATAGFTECATHFAQGNAAMWYDATSAAGLLEDPASSKVVGRVGYAAAPVEVTASSGWLYSWSFGIPTATVHKDAAWQFIAWATSRDYIKLVGRKLGWSRLLPGSRESTYTIPQYRKVSRPFGGPTLAAIRRADPEHPTVQPVPYTGVQFLDIPEFQDLGTRVSQQINAAIAGQQSVRSALDQSQQYAQTVGRGYRQPSHQEGPHGR
ncbi:sugar ABC transporter substrate-binding protein [Streptomyces sp. NPDC020742]|uniref:ABC transporter substrate-binding protein n=1 Tax=Streptomyces sp. NPDC020742 TaxID=3154897 RepID=UPI0033EBF4D8